MSASRSRRDARRRRRARVGGAGLRHRVVWFGLAALSLGTSRCSPTDCDEKAPVNCVRLGFKYEVGAGVTADQARAARLYAKACKLGESSGCISLGVFYSKYSPSVARALAIRGSARSGGAVGARMSRAPARASGHSHPSRSGHASRSRCGPRMLLRRVVDPQLRRQAPAQAARRPHRRSLGCRRGPPGY